jgi:4-hydroxy-2-oxoheptanedioate aldolase
MGKTPAMETDDPDFVSALRHVREAAVKNGVAPGLHVADIPMAQRRLAEGWKFIAIASELGFMVQGASDTVAAVINKGASQPVARY